MEYDFMKRGYLLLDGGKDVIDVLKRSQLKLAQPPVYLIDSSKFKPQLLKFVPTVPFWKPSP